MWKRANIGVFSNAPQRLMYGKHPIESTDL